MDEATRRGDRPNMLWLETQAIANALDFGRWDEALRRADAHLAHGDHYTSDTIMNLKAYVLAARGETTEARALRDAAFERTRRIRDSQSAIPGRLEAALVSVVLGDLDTARTLVAETWPMLRDSRHRAPGVNAALTMAVIRCGRADDWLSFHTRNAPTRRVQAATLMLSGRYVEAAEAWALVSPHDEALTRLEAARALVGEGRRAEADVQLQRGLAFFRAVGATRIVRQAEQLLAAAS